jgi:hypothetical protein
MRRMGVELLRLAAIIVALATSTPLCECQLIGAAPIPAPTISRARNGTSIHGKIDLSFIETGKSTRSEILPKLADIDTGYGDERFFLGRVD